MYCPKCGAAVDGAFCTQCGFNLQAYTTGGGQSFAPPQPPAANSAAPDYIAGAYNGIKKNVKHTFNDITGGENADVKFSLKDLCCNVFKKHSAEEGDELLISGTGKTTPRLRDVAEEWSRPWMYSRIFLVLAVTFALLYVCASEFNNILSVPGLIFVGAMAIPFSLLVLFWETNIPRNVSLFELVKLFFVGGVFSLVVTLVLFEIYPTGELDVGGAIAVGIIEELGKMIPVFFFIRMSKSKYMLNGLLIGAAIGTGFSVFESAGYAFVCGFTNRGFMLDGVLDNILLRGWLSVGGHIVWAAMTGAALMLAKGDGVLDVTAFKSRKFWQLFAVPVVLHAVWDMPFSSIPVLVGLIVIAWVFILALIKSGMSQITRIIAAEDVAAESPEQTEVSQNNL